MELSVSNLIGFAVSTDTSQERTYLVCTRRDPVTFRMCNFEEDVEDFPLVVVVESATDHNRRYHK